jgi:hypothetical protein
MMGVESTRNMYGNFAVNNKDDCLKLHHVGYLINRVMMRGTTNIKFLISNFCHVLYVVLFLLGHSPASEF